MKSSARFGSVVFNKRDGLWVYLWWEKGKRHSKTIGTVADFPTKEAAWQAVKCRRVEQPARALNGSVRQLVEQYREERMPERDSTARGYNAWLDNHVLPRWGNLHIGSLQPRPVELWLQSLALSPKSKQAIRGMIGILWDFAMWRGDVAIERNPMELVQIKNATMRVKQPRSLTVEQFQALLQQFNDNCCLRTMVLVAVSFGLRISEVLGLKWKDIDWLGKTLAIQRGVVCQVVGDVKSKGSAKRMMIDDDLLEILKQWKQASQFTEAEDWIFASPVKLGRQPLSFTYVADTLEEAGERAGIGHVSSHMFRHTFRTWLDSTGTPVGVQQKLMRHSDIRTTMNVYGDALTDDMRKASSAVARLALASASATATAGA